MEPFSWIAMILGLAGLGASIGGAAQQAGQANKWNDSEEARRQRNAEAKERAIAMLQPEKIWSGIPQMMSQSRAPQPTPPWAKVNMPSGPPSGPAMPRLTGLPVPPRGL